MADDLDRASELEQLQRDHALQLHRSMFDSNKPSRTHCMDCGGEIPEKRRALGGVKRCVCCARYVEVKKKLGATW